MKPIKLSIKAEAYDCYIYGSYIFFLMRDGRVLYCSYPKLMSILQHKYREYSGLIKIAFLRNDYYNSKAAEAFMEIPNMKDVLKSEWRRLSEQEDMVLEFDEIEDELELICKLPSTPLDMKIYGMRMFIGCMTGMYEIRLRPSKYDLNPAERETCFDGKVMHLNAKYGEIVLSLGFDGLASASIDVDGDKITKVKDKGIVDGQSSKTCWADTDIVNYSTPNNFSYYQNTTEERSRAGQKKFWQKLETKKIVKFGENVYSMEELISGTSIDRRDILASFNSSEKSILQLRNGSIISYKIKEELRHNNSMRPQLSSRRVNIVAGEEIKGYGRLLSGTIVPKGLVLEFFDKVALLQNSMVSVIEEEEVMKVRSFMNTYRFQDLLSITKMDAITLHALDTLDMLQERQSYRKSAAPAIPADVFDTLGDVSIASSKVKGDDENGELPW